VKRTEPGVILARMPQLDIFGNQIYNVNPGFNLVYGRHIVICVIYMKRND